MESINGRIQTLQNHLQELAQTTINTDWIKDTVSLFDKLAQVAEFVVKNFSSANLAAGALLGTVQMMKGIKLFDIGENGIKGGEIVNFIKNRMTGGIEDQVLASMRGGLFEEDASAKDFIMKVLNVDTLDGAINKFSEESQKSLRLVWDEIENGGKKAGQVFRQDMYGNFTVIDQTVEQTKAKLSGMFTQLQGFAKSIGTAFLNVAATAGISFLVSSGVKLIANGIDEILHHEDRLIEKSKEAKQSIENVYSEIEKKQDGIKDIAIKINVDDAKTKNVYQNIDAIAKRYSTLKKGVNDLNNANKSLSTKEYKEYLDISNKLSKQYPTLIKGYDDQGNAIIRLGDNASATAEKLTEMYKSAVEASTVDLDSNVDTVFDGLMARINQLKSETSFINYETANEELTKIQDALNNTTFNVVDGMNNGNIIELANHSIESLNAFQDAIKQFNQNNTIKLEYEGVLDANGNFTDMQNISNYNKLSDKQKEELYGYYSSSYEDATKKEVEAYETVIEKNQDNYFKYLSQIEDTYAQGTAEISRWLKQSNAFMNFGSEIQTAILSGFEFNPETASEFFETYKGSFYDFVYGEVIEPLNNLSDEASKQLSSALKFDYAGSDKTVEELSEYYTNIFTEVFGEENVSKMFDYFNIDEILSGLEQKRQDVLDRLKETTGGLTQDQTDFIMGMNPEELSKAYDIAFGGIYKVFDKFKTAFSEPIKIKQNGVFSDILNDEEYKAKSESIEKSLAAIMNSINDFNNMDTKSLLDAVPELKQEDYADVESLQKAATDQLTKWIDLLYKQADASKLSREEMGKLNDYVVSLISTYSDADISQSDLYEALYSGIDVKDNVSAEKRDAVARGLMNDISDTIESEDDYAVAYATIQVLASTEDAEFTLDNFLKIYGQMKAKFEVTAETKEFEQRMKLIEDTIKQAQQNVSTAQAQREYDNARGIYSNDALYIQRQIVGKGIEKLNIDKQIEDYRTGKNTNSVAYRKEHGGFANDTELQEAIRAEELAIAQLEAQKIQIDVEIVGLEDEKTLLPLTRMENELQVLQKEGEELNTVLEKKGKFVTIEDYTASIDNASDQIKLLRKEEKFWQDQLKNPVLEKTGEKYLEYNGKLSDVRKSIDDLVEAQNNWNNAISNMPIEEAQKKIDALKNLLGIAESEASVEEAKGEKKSNETYTKENETYKSVSDESNVKVQQARTNVNNTIRKTDGNLFERMRNDKISAVYTDQNVKEPIIAKPQIIKDAEVISANIEVINDSVVEGNENLANYYKNIHAWEEQQISDAQAELEKRQTANTDFARMIASEYTDKNFEVPESILNIQSLNFDSTLAQAKELETLLNDLILQNTDKNGNRNTYAENYQKQLDGLKTTIDDINKQKIQVDTQISERNIGNIQLGIEDTEKSIKRLNDNLLTTSDKGGIYNNLISESYNEIGLLQQQASEYSSLMHNLEIDAELNNKTLDKNGGLWKTYSDNMDATNDKIRDILKNIVTYREEFLKLPENKIGQRIESLNAQQGINRSTLQYKQASGNNIINPSDYDAILANDQTNIVMSNNLLETRKQRLAELSAEIDSMNTVSEEKLLEQHQAVLDVYDAEQQLYGAMQQLAEDQKAANDAILNEYNERIRVINKGAEDMLNQRSIDEALGKRRDLYDVQVDLKISNTSLAETQQALDNLSLDDFIGIGDTEEEKRASQQRQYDEMETYLKEQLTKYQVDKIKYEQEEDFLPVTELERAIKEYEDAWTDLQTVKEKAKREGRDLTDDEYDQIKKNLNSRESGLNVLKGLYENLYETYKGTTVGDDIIESLNQVDQKLADIDAEKFNVDYEIDTKPLNDLQEQMGYLTREADTFKEALSNPGSATSMSKKDALTGLIQNNNEQMKNLVKQAEQYQNRMEAIKQENPDDYLFNDLYIEAATGLANTNSAMKELTNSTREYYETLKNLPQEAIDRMLAYLNALQGYTDAQRNLKQAQGGILTEADYQSDIDIAESTLQTKKDELELKKNTTAEKGARLNAARLNQDTGIFGSVDNAQAEYEEAVTAELEAETAILNAEADVFKARKEAFEAGQQQYEQAISLLQNYKSNLESARELSEALGNDTRNGNAILGDIDVAKELRSDLQQQLKDLETDYENGTSGLDPYEYSKRRVELETSIRDIEKEILEYGKEFAEYPNKNRQLEYEELKKTGDELDYMIASLRNLDKEVPDDLLTQKLGNIKDQKKNVEDQITFYEGLINQFENGFAGKLMSSIGSVFGADDFGKKFINGWEETLANLRDQKLGLESDEKTTQDEIDNKTIQQLDNSLNDLRKNAKSIQRELNDTYEPKNVKDYTEAIKNANLQQINLKQQMQEIQEQMKDFKEDDPGYIELKSQLESLDDEYIALGEDVKVWVSEMNNLKLESITRQLDDFISVFDRFETSLNNRSDLGYRMTDSDYDRLIRGYEDEAELQGLSYKEAYNKTKLIPGTNMTVLDTEIEKGSPEYEKLVDDAEQLYETYLGTLQTIEKLKQEKQLLPVQQMQREQQEFQEAFDEITRTYENSPFGPSNAQLNDQLGILSSMEGNLLWQKSFYERMEKQFERNKLFDKAQEMHEAALQVQKDIDEINANQISIQAEIDMKPFNRLQEEYGELESESQILSTKLANLLDPNSETAEKLQKQLANNAKHRMTLISQEMTSYMDEMARMEEVAEKEGRDVRDMSSKKFGDKTYSELKTSLEGLKNTYITLRKEVVDTNNAIDNIKLNRIQNDIEKLQNSMALTSSISNLKVALGVTLMPEDLQKGVDEAAQNVDLALDVKAEKIVNLENAERDLDNFKKVTFDPFLSDLSKNLTLNLDSDVSMANLKTGVETATEELETAETDVNTKLQQFIEQSFDQISANTANLAKKAEIMSSNYDELKSVISTDESENLVSDQGNYLDALAKNQELINLYSQMVSEISGNMKDELLNLFEVVKNEYGFEFSVDDQNNLIAQLDTQVLELTGNMRTLTAESQEFRKMLFGGAEVVKLTDEFNKLTAEAERFNSEIQKVTALGGKVSPMYYAGLSENYAQQIENLQNQNKAMSMRQQSDVMLTKVQYDELESSIQSNLNTIDTLHQNLKEANDQLKYYAENAAQSLTTTLSSALTESSSAIGLSTSTMSALVAEFDDMAKTIGFDMTSLFNNTSKGVKLNINALKSLLKIQKAVYGGSILNAINKENQLIRQAVPAINAKGNAERNEAKQTLEGYRSKLRAMNKQLSGYNTMMKALEEMTSRYSKWQEATQTENEGDKMMKFAEAAPDYEKMRNEGKIGTDEFKAYTALENYWGDTHYRAYDLMYPTMERLIRPEGGDMVTAFMDYLTELGFATKDQNNVYDIQNLDLDKVARKTGLSTEFIEMEIGLLRDYGFVITTVKSEEDGLIQSQEKRADLMEQFQRLSEKQIKGTLTPEWITISEDEIASLQIQLDNIDKAMDEFKHQRGVPFSEEDYNIQVSYLKKLTEYAQQLYDSGDMTGFAQVADEVERVSKQYGLGIEIPLKGMWELDPASYQDAVRRVNEYQAEMETHLPDLYKIYNEAGTEALEGYKSALSTVKEYAEKNKVAINFDFDPQDENNSIQDIKAHLDSLNSLKASVGVQMDPVAEQTLDNLIKLDQAEIGLRLTLQTSEAMANGVTVQEIARMAAEDNQQAIDLVMSLNANATTEEAQAIVDLAKAKALDIPMKVTLDQASIDALAQAFGQEIPSEKEVKVKPTVDDTELQNGLDNLVNDTGIKDKLQNVFQVDDDLMMKYYESWKNAGNQVANGINDGIVIIEESGQELKQSLEDVMSPPNMDSTGTVEYFDGVATSLDNANQSATIASQNIEKVQQDFDQLITKAASDQIANITMSADTTQAEESINNITQNKTSQVTVTADTTSVNESVEKIMENDQLVMEIYSDTTHYEEDTQTATNKIVEENKPVVTVDGETSELTQKASSASAQVESENHPVVTVDGNTNPLLSKIQEARNLASQPISIEVTANQVSIWNSIQGYLNNVTFQANVQANVQATGGVIARAYGNLGAYANGSNKITKNQDALVNEVMIGGQREGIIRNGVLTEIPGGMHIERLQKGDVVVNSAQMTQLKKYGEAQGQARVVGGQSAFLSNSQNIDGLLSAEKKDELIKSFAYGSLDKIPSYPYGSNYIVSGLSSGGGALYPANFTSMGNMFNPIDESVDELDDFKDSAGDAGDGLDDLNDSINHSKQTIDYVQRALTHFANETQKITDRITEYIDLSLKKSLLQQQEGALLNQIYANSRGATVYNSKAEEIASSFTYYDKEGNELSLSLASALNLDALRNGDYRLEDIDTSTEYGQALYDAASQYMDMVDKANQAQMAVQGFINELKNVYSQIIQLPFDNLSKQLSKLDNMMQTIDSYMNTASSGKSGIFALQDILSSIYGRGGAIRRLDATGTTYEVQNRQIDQNLSLQRDQVVANEIALDEAKQTVSDLKITVHRAQSSVNFDREHTLYNIPLSAEDRENVRNGRQIDASKYSSVYGAELANYNRNAGKLEAATDALRLAQEKEEEQSRALEQSAAQMAQDTINSVFTKLENIGNYFQSFVDRQSAIIEHLDADAGYLESLQGYAGNQTSFFDIYSNQIQRYGLQIELTAENIEKQEAELEKAVKNNVFYRDSEEYREAKNRIEALKTEYINLQNTQLQTFKTMLQIPDREMEEKINRIQTSFRGLNAVMSNNIADSASTIAMYQKLNSTAMGSIGGEKQQVNAGQIDFSKAYKNGVDYTKEFIAQNYVIAQNVEQENKILAERYATLMEKEKLYQAILKKNGKDSDEARIAREDLENSQTEYLDQQAKAISAQVSAIESMVNNIKSYYDSVCNYYDALAKRAQQARTDIQDTIKLYSEYPSADLVSSYNEEISYYLEQYDLLRRSSETMLAQLNYAVEKGIIEENSSTYREIMQTILGVQDQIDETRRKQEDLYIEMMKIPSDVVENKINDITNAYSRLNTAISANITDTSATQRMYAQISKTIDTAVGIKRNPNQNYFDDYDYGVSYIGQNMAYLDNIQQLREQAATNLQGAMATKELMDRASTDRERAVAKEQYEEQLNSARQAYAELIKLEAESTMTIVNNIEAYYGRISGLINSVTNNLNTIRSYFIQIGGYSKYADTIFDSYNENIRRTKTEISVLNNEIEVIRGQIQEGLDSGKFTTNDDEYVDLITKLQSLQTEATNTATSLYSLYKEMYDMPNQVVTEKIEDIEKAYRSLTTVINNSNIATTANQRVLRDVANEYSKYFYYMRPEKYDFAIGETFVGQNTALLADLQKTKEELDLLAYTYMETGYNLEQITLRTQEQLDSIPDIEINNEPSDIIDNNIIIPQPEEQIHEELLDEYSEFVEDQNQSRADINKELNEVLSSGITKEDNQEFFEMQKQLRLDTNQELKRMIDAGTVQEGSEFEGALSKRNQIAQKYNNEFSESFEQLYPSNQDEIFDDFISGISEDDYFYAGRLSMPEVTISVPVELEPDLGFTDGLNDNLGFTDGRDLLDQFTDGGEVFDQFTDGLSNKLNYSLDSAFTTELPEDTAKYAQEYMEQFKHHFDEMVDYGEELEDINWDAPAEAITKNLSVLDNTSYSIKLPHPEAIVDDNEKTFEEIPNVAEEVSERVKKSVAGTVDFVQVELQGTQEEIKAAQDAFDTAQANFESKQAEYAKQVVEYATQSIQNINTYYNSLISYQDALTNRYASFISLMNQLGRSMDSSGNLISNTEKVVESYTKQIDEMTSKQSLLAKSIVEQEYQMEQVKETIGEDSEEYREMKATLMGLENQFDETTMSIDKLQDTMRNELYLKPIQEAIEKVQNLRNSFSSLNSLLEEEGKISDEGQYTESGILSLSLNAAAYNQSRLELEKAIEEYRTMNERWKVDDSYSDEQYLADRQTAISAIQSAMQSTYSGQQAILTQIKNRYRTEIDYIKELINAQSEELNKRKELDDYDKSLKEKTNSVKQIEMQIKAIEGLTDVESKAQKARLQEQLQQAQDDLDDTVQNHVVSLRQDALSELSKQLDEGYEKYTKELATNFEKANQTVIDTETNLEEYLDQASSTLDSNLKLYSENLTTEMLLGVNSIKAGFSEDMSKLYSDDLIISEQAEKEKAEKLEAYEIAKQTALSTFKEDVDARQEAVQKLLENIQTRTDTGIDDTKTYLDSISNNSALTKEAIDNVVTALANNGGAIVSTGDSLKTALSTAISDYSNPGNPIHDALTNTLVGMDTITEKIALLDSDERLRDIHNEAKANVQKLDSIQSYLDNVTISAESFNDYKTKVLDALKALNKIKHSGSKKDPYYVESGTDTAKTNKSSQDDILHSLKQSYVIYEGIYAKVEMLAKREQDSKNSNSYNDNSLMDSNGYLLLDEPLLIPRDEVDFGFVQGDSYYNGRRYAKGTKSAKPGVSQVFEEGPEIITTKKGTFIPFNGGEGVVPAKQTETLMRLADSFANGQLQLQMPDMSRYKVPELRTNNNISNTVHVDSLITINGNADAETVDQIKQIAQQLINNRQFGEQITQVVSKRQAADSRMMGKRQSVR